MAVKEVLLVFLGLNLATLILGHGRMIEPAARNAAWRYGFKVPPNYNDNQQNCGGFNTQKSNNGKCGVCGDAYNARNPSHVFPGKYAKSVVTKVYKVNKVIRVKIEITANHKGWFEFRLGKLKKLPVTQGQLTHLLHLVEGGTRWYLTSTENKVYNIDLKLPQNLTCDHCVLQWWWTCGNNWGCDKDKKCGVGHGPQETFVNCADICILPSDDSSNGRDTTQTPLPTGTEQVRTTPKQGYVATSSLSTSRQNEATTKRTPSTRSPTTSGTTSAPRTFRPKEGDCRANAVYSGQAGMDEWCRVNCAAGYCPDSHCICRTSANPEKPTTPRSTCKATGRWKGQLAMDSWCVQNCAQGHCPASHCKCEKPGATEIPTTPSSTCKATGRWMGQSAMDNWCVQNCAQGHCPASHCKCEKPGGTEKPTTPGSTCKATGRWKGQSAMDSWCVQNCAQGHCPASHCKCEEPGSTEIPTTPSSMCKATGRWKGQSGMDNWCVQNCAKGYCPASHCECVHNKLTTEKSIES